MTQGMVNTNASYCFRGCIAIQIFLFSAVSLLHVRSATAFHYFAGVVFWAAFVVAAVSLIITLATRKSAKRARGKRVDVCLAAVWLASLAATFIWTIKQGV